MTNEVREQVAQILEDNFDCDCLLRTETGYESFDLTSKVTKLLLSIPPIQQGLKAVGKLEELQKEHPGCRLAVIKDGFSITDATGKRHYFGSAVLWQGEGR